MISIRGAKSPTTQSAAPRNDRLEEEIATSSRCFSSHVCLRPTVRPQDRFANAASTPVREGSAGNDTLETQVLDSHSIVDQRFERINPDAQVHVRIVLRNLPVAAGGLDAARDHGLVGHQ